jgi:hypothetical protein
MTTLPAPDPRNVRDALLEAGYPIHVVERMLLAAQGRFVSATEDWPDHVFLQHRPDIRPQLLANTWIRIAEALGRESLKTGALMREETREGDITTLRGKLWVLGNR